MKGALVVLVLLLTSLSPVWAGTATSRHNEFVAEYTRKAAERGDAEAQYRMGTIYLTGRGVTRDVTEAIRWWRDAAERGHARAQFSLGRYMPSDASVRASKPPVFWYCKAISNRAELVGREEPFVLSALGRIRAQGSGASRDYVRAHMYFNLAAARDPRFGTWSRDLLAKEMTPDQIAEAQRLASEWTADKPCP